jgi:hypothetical protein
VLATGIFVFVDGPALACPLGLSDVIDVGFVVGFSTGTFHYAGQSLIIQSTSSLVMQYYISNHFFFGSLAAWIHIWCLDALNRAIPSDSWTTSIGMCHTLVVHCCISSRSIVNTCYFLVDFWYPWPARGIRTWLRSTSLSYLEKKKILAPATLAK